jgi:hypothetical protein
MLFFLAFHFSLSLTPNCRNWSPNYSVLVKLRVHNHFFDPRYNFIEKAYLELLKKHDINCSQESPIR